MRESPRNYAKLQLYMGDRGIVQWLGNRDNIKYIDLS